MWLGEGGICGKRVRVDGLVVLRVEVGRWVGVIGGVGVSQWGGGGVGKGGLLVKESAYLYYGLLEEMWRSKRCSPASDWKLWSQLTWKIC